MEEGAIITQNDISKAQRKAEAFRLICEGEDIKEVAAVVQVDAVTIRRWMRAEKSLQSFREIYKENAVADYSKAIAVLRKQLDSSNPWIAQGAAREIITRFGPMITGESNSTVSIQLVGAPTLGMPENKNLSDAEIEGISENTP